VVVDSVVVVDLAEAVPREVGNDDPKMVQQLLERNGR